MGDTIEQLRVERCELARALLKAEQALCSEFGGTFDGDENPDWPELDQAYFDAVDLALALRAPCSPPESQPEESSE